MRNYTYTTAKISQTWIRLTWNGEGTTYLALVSNIELLEEDSGGTTIHYAMPNGVLKCLCVRETIEDIEKLMEPKE